MLDVPNSLHCLSNIRDCTILSVQKIEKKLAQQHSFYQNICHYILFSQALKNEIFYLTTFTAPHLQVILEINFRPIEDSNKQDQITVKLSLFFFCLQPINMKSAEAFSFDRL